MTLTDDETVKLFGFIIDAGSKAALFNQCAPNLPDEANQAFYTQIEIRRATNSNRICLERVYEPKGSGTKTDMVVIGSDQSVFTPLPPQQAHDIAKKLNLTGPPIWAASVMDKPTLMDLCWPQPRND